MAERTTAGGRRPHGNGRADADAAARAVRNGGPPEGDAGERSAADPLALAGALAGAVGGALRRAVAARVPPADLDERDPDYIRENLPGLWLLASYYFRADVRGLRHIPADGPVLLVGNHSGGNVTPDTLVFTLAFSTFFGVERRFFQLAHNLVLAMPWLRSLRKFGTVAASQRNAERALESGAALLVYPGGDWEVHRPSWERNRVDFAGRKGFIRLALDRGVPIVPVVAIGGHETALFLARGDRLARLLALDRLFRLKVLPIQLAAPWGLNVGDMLGHLPLPAKITIQVLPPIDLRERYGDEPDLDEVYDDVTARMQRTLDALAKERRLPLVG